MIRLNLLLVIVASLFAQCKSGHQVGEDMQQAAPPDTIVLALDWTPNVLHAGFFLAEINGYFAGENLHVSWFSPEVDGYVKKPVQRLLDAEVDVAIGPSEHLFFFNDTSVGRQAIALASLLQRGQSAFCVKRASGIESPADIQGKKYLGYNTPLENQVLMAMMQHDGAPGDFSIHTPGRLDVWDAFMVGHGDAAWVFTHWEGAMASRDGVDLNFFHLEDYGVPYGYSSVLMALKANAIADAKYHRFLQAMEKGYRELSRMSPAEASLQLSKLSGISNFQDTALMRIAIEDIAGALFNKAGEWGTMRAEIWEKWYAWVIRQAGTDAFNPAQEYFSNEYLSKN